MPSKPVMAVIILCLLAMAWYAIRKEVSRTTQPPLKNLTKPLNVSAQKSQPLVGLNQEKPQLKGILAETEPRLFSDDAYIELLSLRMLMSRCDEPASIAQMFQMYGETYQNQLDLVEQLKLDCQQHALRYPLLMSAMKSKDWLTTIESESQLGHLIKNRPKYPDQKERQAYYQLYLTAALNTGNSVLILNANTAIRYGIMKLSQLKILFDSQDHQYTRKLNHMALTLIACQYQAGMACKSTSNLMLYNCAKTPAACGSDFNTWYNDNTLPGMKQDVEILIQHYTENHNE